MSEKEWRECPAALLLAAVGFVGVLLLNFFPNISVSSWNFMTLPSHAVLTEAFLQVLTQACKYSNNCIHHSGAWLSLILDSEPFGRFAPWLTVVVYELTLPLWDSPALFVIPVARRMPRNHCFMYPSGSNEKEEKCAHLLSLHWYRTDFVCSAQDSYFKLVLWCRHLIPALLETEASADGSLWVLNQPT